MKKILTVSITSLLCGFYVSTASAEGLRYFGSVNVLHTNPTSNLTENKNTSDQFEKNFGLGVSAGLQYNINSAFYVNADIHANYANNTIKASWEDEESGTTYYPSAHSKQNFSYGILSRFGYNINDKSSAYLGLGVDFGKYKAYATEPTIGVFVDESKSIVMPVIAAGFTSDVSKSTQAYLEYQVTRASNFKIADENATYSNRSFVVGVRQFFN